jgi:hypothetical protein
VNRSTEELLWDACPGAPACRAGILSMSEPIGKAPAREGWGVVYARLSTRISRSSFVSSNPSRNPWQICRSSLPWSCSCRSNLRHRFLRFCRLSCRISRLYPRNRTLRPCSRKPPLWRRQPGDAHSRLAPPLNWKQPSSHSTNTLPSRWSLCFVGAPTKLSNLRFAPMMRGSGRGRMRVSCVS